MTIFPLVAQQMTNLSILGLDIKPSQFTGFNALFVLIYSPLIASLWTKMGTHQPSSTTKFTIGLLASSFSFLILLVPIDLYGVGTKFSAWWLILGIAIVEVGEVLLLPAGLSLTTKLAPKAFTAQMMSIWYLGDAAAQSFNAQLVKMYTVNDAPIYFGGMGLIVLGIALVLLFVHKKIANLIKL